MADETQRRVGVGSTSAEVPIVCRRQSRRLGRRPHRGRCAPGWADVQAGLAVADDVDERLAGRLAAAERQNGDLLGSLAAAGSRVDTVEGRVATVEQVLTSWAAAARWEAVRRARAARE